MQSDVGEDVLIRRLRDGDEATFTALVQQYHGAMIRVALGFVRDAATSEEVAQEAWEGVLKGLPSFEHRSSLKSWIFSIVVHKAKTRAVRDARSIPFSALAAQEASSTEPAVDPSRFLGDDARWPGHWAQPPAGWGDDPEARLLGSEFTGRLARILDTLSPAQRAVIVLRDVAGYETAETCNTLGVSETNMRVLLHRARSKVRNALERYFDETKSTEGTR